MIKVIRAYISAKREHVAVNGSIVRGENFYHNGFKQLT